MCDDKGLQSLRELAADVADNLNSMAADLDEHKTNTNIARVTGASVAVVGGVISVIGVVAAPFTAGTSAVLVGVGGGIIAGAGGATAGGAKIVRHFIEKDKLDKASRKWARFRKTLLREMRVDPRDIQNLGEDVKTSMKREKDLARVKMVKDALDFLPRGVQTVKGIVTILPKQAQVLKALGAKVSSAGAPARALLSEAAVVGGRSVPVVAVAGSALLNVVVIGVSLYDIVDGAIELSRKSGSSAGETLRDMALTLNKFACTGEWVD